MDLVLKIFAAKIQSPKSQMKILIRMEQETIQIKIYRIKIYIYYFEVFENNSIK